MSYLDFDVDVQTWITREADPENSWSRDSTGGSVSIRSAKLVSRDGYGVLQTAFSVAPGDTVYLVWAQYSTGDSFGSDGGKYELCAVYDNAEDAATERERLEKVTDFSVPWTGYFEDLDFVRVEALTVEA